MASVTTNYGLLKPAGTDYVDEVLHLDNNWDTIDTQLKATNDRVTALEATWQTYTPVLSGGGSLGNGTAKGRYLKVNKLCVAKIAIQFGSTSSWGLAGSVSAVSLPLTGKTLTGTDLNEALGHGLAYKGSTGVPKVVMGSVNGSDFSTVYLYCDGSVLDQSVIPNHAANTLGLTVVYELP